MQRSLARCMRGIGVNGMRKRKLPIWRGRLGQKERPHLVCVEQSALTEATSGVRLSEKHECSFAVELVSNGLPMPSGGMRGVKKCKRINL